MKIAEIGLRETNRFSDLFLDYIEESNDALRDFYNQFPDLENFKEQISNKDFPKKNREVLASVLANQYANIKTTAFTDKHLSLLTDENTFTVTTGHQLNIFTGPLYFIYKIVTVIVTCKKLKKRYPKYNFVPVYWMASEDHDFEEIDHFVLEGKKYTWSTDQKGAVGRFSTKGLSEIADQIAGMPEAFKEAYSKSSTLAEACLNYVNSLFGDYGLIVVDADNKELKRLFSPVIEDDLLNNSAKQAVEHTTIAIEKLGYNTQVNPRAINLFYLKDDIRERIEYSSATFNVFNSNIKFTADELKKEIEVHPERFSPNVVLRPLYQEMVLPNLAYVGGPSEVAYWFQLREVFSHYNVSFPILMPRNFAALIPMNIKRKAMKTGLAWKDFFKPQHLLHKAVAIDESGDKILLNGQVEKIMQLFRQVKNQAENIDQSLVAHVEAQSAITKRKLEGIEKKFIRAEKRKHTDKLRQIDEVLAQFFPNNSLQERRENFISYYLIDHKLIEHLIDSFDPFNFKFYMLENG